jgi:hypothetical protein
MSPVRPKSIRAFLAKHCEKSGLPKGMRVQMKDETAVRRMVLVMMNRYCENARGQILTPKHVYNYLIEDWTSECLWDAAEKLDCKEFLVEDEEDGCYIWDEDEEVNRLVHIAHGWVFETDFEKTIQKF